jgi:hypothetical protein
MIAAVKNPRIVAVFALAFIAIVIAVVVRAHGQGTGSCYTGDPKAPSAPADRALYAGAPEVTGTSPVVVEVVQGKMLGQHRTMAADGSAVVGISGWAVDPAAKRAAPVVLVRVDDQPLLRADTCGERADVASALGVPAYRRSGFGLRLAPVPGVHRLAFFVLGADGRTLYRDPRDLELSVSQPAGVRTTPAVQGGLTRLDDVAVPAAVSGGAPLSHPIGTDLRIDGWMIDRTRATPAELRSLDVLVDGRFAVRAAYGAARPDVAGFLHAPEASNVGFTARLLTDGIPPGRHRITFRAIVADGRSATLATPLVVDLTRPPGS